MRSKLIFTIAILFSFGISLMFLSSCSEDEEPIPDPATILLNPDLGAEEGEPGDVISTQVSVSAPAGLLSVTINKTIGDGSPSEYQNELPNAGENQLVFDFSYTLVAAEVGETVTFDIIVEDESSATSAIKTFTVETLSPPARSYTAVLLAAPLGTKESLTFFSSNTGERYSMQQVLDAEETLSADIDFGYFYGSGSSGTAATLSDPASYPFAYGQSAWTVRNSTVFQTTELTSSSFNEIVTFADIDVAVEGADDPDSDPGIIASLAEGDVLVFTTDDGKEGGSKKGLILISSITPGDGENGQITLEIIVQEDAE